MKHRAVRILKGLSTVHNLCWIAVSFIIAHFVILDQAMDQVLQLSNEDRHLRELVFWSPGALPDALSHLTVDVRSLYVTVEVSAGMIETLLLALVCLSVLMYLFFRFKPDKRLLKWCLASTGLLLISDLTLRIGLIYLLDHGIEPMHWAVPLLRSFALLKLLGLAGCVVCALCMLPASIWPFRGSGSHVNTS